MAFVGIYTENEQEMHDLKCILGAWRIHIWSEKNTNVSFFSTKNHSQISY
jgi:hypothetical protein